VFVDSEAQLPVLVLAWHFAAQKQGYFTRKEFVNGLMKLECYSIYISLNALYPLDPAPSSCLYHLSVS
jgi:hypothetical protein